MIGDRLTLIGLAFSLFAVFLGLMVLVAILIFGGVDPVWDAVTAVVIIICGVLLFFGLERKIRNTRPGLTLKDMFTRSLYRE